LGGGVNVLEGEGVNTVKTLKFEKGGECMTPPQPLWWCSPGWVQVHVIRRKHAGSDLIDHKVAIVYALWRLEQGTNDTHQWLHVCIASLAASSGLKE